MKILSYAQNREDVLLNRLFPRRPDGFYIDVGACHPTVDSVTRLFYERGWRGINIEPTPSLFELLARDRMRDVNLPVGLSDREGTLRFYEVPSALGFCTFSPERADELRGEGYELVEHSIPVTTLARVCEEHAGATIDFLKIDVESFEREVIVGGDWVRFRPRVVLVEATRPTTSIPSHEEWEPLLLSNGYLFAFFDGLNRYYVRAEDSDLLPTLAVPANVLDDFETYEHFERNRNHEHLIRGLHGQVGELHGQIEGLEDQVGKLQDQVDFYGRQMRGLERAYDEIMSLRGAVREACEEARLTRADLAASRLAHEATRAELAGTVAELAGTVAELEGVRGLCAAMGAELDAARGRLALFEGWGPMTVSVVSRLRRACLRWPMAKPMLQRALQVRRRLISAPTNGLASR